jgi:hypothetical protein
MLRHAIIGKAVDLVSGPGGLASFLRTRLLGARLAGPSPPLDVGHSADIPAAIRRAVILRDQHCRWAGGCGALPAYVRRPHDERLRASRPGPCCGPAIRHDPAPTSVVITWPNRPVKSLLHQHTDRCLGGFRLVGAVCAL